MGWHSCWGHKVTLSFLEKSPKAILADILAAYQDSSGKVLYPAQIENLLLHVQAYRESLLRNDIQWCAEQNLVAYAIDEHLDALGVMMATPRLQPTSAQCRVHLILDEASIPGRAFPPGLRITTEDGKFCFETIDPLYVISNQDESNTDVVAVCTALGKDANGLEPGIVCLLDPAITGVSVVNTTATEGGGDLEGDAAYRERLMMAAARFGCGGSAKAYRYWALTASSLVLDALAVNGAERGDINIYVLADGGTPSQELLATVQETCNSDDVRLIGDYITAIPAVKLEYTINAEITVYDTHDPDIVLDQVGILAAEYARTHKRKLGADVTPTQVLMALSPQGAGLYHVNLIEPSSILEVGPNEWAEATAITITLAGVANG